MATNLVERIKRINIDIFNYTVFVVFTNDLIRSAESRGITPSGPVAGMHIRAEENLPASQIVLPFGVSVEVIAHECVHCAWAMLTIIGAKLDDETLAYCSSYLVGQIIKFQQKITKSGK